MLGQKVCGTMGNEVKEMDSSRKKELLQQWKNRRPEMGIISFRCRETGEAFLGISKDTKADINSNRFRLSMGMHPNKRLAELWNEYGEEGFECSVVKILKIENPDDDYTEELEQLREQCFAADRKAGKLWK